MRHILFLATFLAFSFVARAAEPGHKVLAADRGTGKMAIINAKGEIEWEFDNKHDVHDLHMLPNGNILIADSGYGKVVEREPDGTEVWSMNGRDTNNSQLVRAYVR